MNKNKRILLVDDHAGLLRLIAMELKLEGYEVVTAPNGKEALSIINSVTAPDLVVLDIMMPVMNGLETLSVLRKSSNMPVIACSFDERKREQALDLGADDFLVKPFAPEALLRKIHRLVR